MGLRPAPVRRPLARWRGGSFWRSFHRAGSWGSRPTSPPTWRRCPYSGRSPWGSTCSRTSWRLRERRGGGRKRPRPAFPWSWYPLSWSWARGWSSSSGFRCTSWPSSWGRWCVMDSLRPRDQSAKHATAFYLAIAVGGVLGGTFNTLFAPLIFDRLIEYPLAVVLACLAAPGLARPVETAKPRRSVRRSDAAGDRLRADGDPGDEPGRGCRLGAGDAGGDDGLGPGAVLVRDGLAATGPIRAHGGRGPSGQRTGAKPRRPVDPPRTGLLRHAEGSLRSARRTSIACFREARSTASRAWIRPAGASPRPTSRVPVRSARSSRPWNPG